MISISKTTLGSDSVLAKKLRGACESELTVKSSDPEVASKDVSKPELEHRSTGLSHGLSTDTCEQVYSSYTIPPQLVPVS